MSLRRVGGKAIIYAAANGVGSGAQLLLVLYCAYILAGESLGVLTLFIAMVALATQVLGLGLTASFQRDFFTAPSHLRPVFLSTIVWVVVLVGCALILLAAGAGLALSAWLESPGLLVVALLGALGQALQQFLLITWQSEDAALDYARFFLVFCVAQLGVPIGLIHWVDMGWQSAVIGQALVFCGSGLLSLLILRRKGYLTCRIDKDYLRRSLAYGLPLVPYQLAGWGMAMLDRFLITAFSGVAVAGYYALAFQVAQVINIASSGFVQAFTPWLYAALGRQDDRLRPQIGRLVALYAMGLAVLCGVGYLSFRVFADIIARHSYQQAILYAPWLFLAMFFNGMYRIVSCFTLFHGSTGRLALITLGVAVTSALLNVTLLPAHGAIASAWIVSLSFGLLFGLTLLTEMARTRV